MQQNVRIDAAAIGAAIRTVLNGCDADTAELLAAVRNHQWERARAMKERLIARHLRIRSLCDRLVESQPVPPKG